MTTANRTRRVPVFSIHAAMRMAALAAATLMPLSAAVADDPPFSGSGFTYSGGGGAPVRADGHAPIGVMGDHMHHKGEWMLSYRYMHMDMEGNRIGTDERVATRSLQVPNRFWRTAAADAAHRADCP